MNRIVGRSLLFVVALSACENVTLIPRVAGIRDASDLELPPMAMTFQKMGQFGHTDYNQRKEDMIACGIPREEYEDNLYAFRGRNPGETTEQFDARRKSFLQCLRAKNYLWLGLEECGPVKENRGICK